MPTYILPLTSSALTLANAGGKGANLNKLLAGGFPVPPGFVITTDAYHAFVAANQLAATLTRLSAATDLARPGTFETASDALRAQFERGALPPDLADAISTAYRRLAAAEPAVAVRSSATAEDLPQASFAGQQDTYLNIRGEAAVLAAVQKCWGSLWTARSMAYRRQQAIPPEGVALAVVIQLMLPATAAGVLFTLNPVTGQRAEMVINANWGLGEALVSGQVNPDTLVVDKATGAIKHLDIGEKAVMTATTETGTAEVPVDDARRQQSVLSPAQAAELARLGRAVEAYFGGPQDIEWALAGGALTLLQARPITTHGGVPGDDDWLPLHTAAPQPYDVWSQADMGERWPEPVTPLTWSVWEGLTNDSFRVSLRALPSPMPQQTQWARRAYGRVYMNEGALLHVYTRELGMPAASIAASIGGQSAGGQAPGADKWNWGIVARRAPVLLKMMSTMQSQAKAFEADFPKIDAWVEAFRRRDLSAASDAELWAEGLTTWRSRALHYIDYHTSVTGLSTSNLPMLENLTERWLGDRALAQTLITGLTGVIQAEMVPALQALAQTIRQLGLADLLLSQPPAAALAQLRATPAAAPVLEQLDAFLERHGHRCATEAEWLYPRWIEAPELVLETVAGYLQNDRAAGFADNTARQQRQRAEAEARALARLDPFRRAYFRRVLAQVQRLVRLRDNGQNYLVKLLLPWRLILAELGARWAARGWLAQPEDIFFLVREDIQSVLPANGPAPAGLDLRAIVQARRQAYAYWFTVTAPEVLDAAGEPVLAAPAPANAANQLSGIAASRGQVTGVARLISNPREAGRLRPGEILVTRATDPGWTPVFSVAGGVVLEVGGLLSHGAIVAREYGLPAVVNVPDALRRIQEGQTITVNGTAGRVDLTPL